MTSLVIDFHVALVFYSPGPVRHKESLQTKPVFPSTNVVNYKLVHINWAQLLLGKSTSDVGAVQRPDGQNSGPICSGVDKKYKDRKSLARYRPNEEKQD